MRMYLLAYPTLLSIYLFNYLMQFIDEVGAIVADIGTLHSRFGSAGQDSPKHVFYSVSRSSCNYYSWLSIFEFLVVVVVLLLISLDLILTLRLPLVTRFRSQGAGVTPANRRTRRYNHKLGAFRHIEENMEQTEIISVMSPDGGMHACMHACIALLSSVMLLASCYWCLLCVFMYQ
jgi:hypothetical protein